MAMNSQKKEEKKMADNTQNTPQNISVISAFEQLFEAQSKWNKFRPGQGEATFE
jgi:hypothetical protein